MTKEFIYTYFGSNGSVTTPVKLEGVPSITRICLTADGNKHLTNGKITVKSTIVASDGEAALWEEK